MAIEALEVLKRFITRGNVSLDTIPPLEGALLPNNGLEEARLHPAGPVDEPNDVHVDRRGLWVASRDRLLTAMPGGDAWLPHARLPSTITAMAPLGDSWLVATASDGLYEVRPNGALGQRISDPGALSGSVTDLAVAANGDVFAAVGSRSNAAVDWYVDLMQKGATGSIWRRSGLRGDWQLVADSLAWPGGISVHDMVLTYTEAWRHRVSRMDLQTPGRPRVISRNLPGYPGRIRAAKAGGFWLSVFAMRTQLVEFVLTQDDYRRGMMAEIDPRFWVRPDLRTLNTGLVPLQGGGIKKLGQTKPWAPPRSYGLVVHVDDDGEITRSYHSRAGGVVHGVTGAAEFEGELVACAQGGDVVVLLGRV